MTNRSRLAAALLGASLAVPLVAAGPASADIVPLPPLPTVDTTCLNATDIAQCEISSLQGTVTGGTFNPSATCTAECTSSDFVSAFFGATAQFTCNNGYAGCRFSFEYTAQRHHRQGLLYHHWVDRGTDGVNEIFIGDIAST